MVGGPVFDEVRGNRAAAITREQRIAETFVELADTLVDDFDVIDFLQKVAARCVELPEVSATGGMLADQKGALVAVAAAHERARLVDLFELQNDEGPGRDCYQHGAAGLNVDLDAAVERWPMRPRSASCSSARSARARFSPVSCRPR